MAALPSDDLTQLRRLVEALKIVVAREIEIETSKLLEIAKQMPIERIEARGSESLPIPGKEMTFRKRAKFGHQKR